MQILLYFGMLFLSTNKVLAERYLPVDIWDVTVAKDVPEDKNLGIQNTGAIWINLADVVLTNFHVQTAGRNKLAYHSASGIMNIFSLSNIKIQFRHLQNTYMEVDTRWGPWKLS